MSHFPVTIYRALHRQRILIKDVKFIHIRKEWVGRGHFVTFEPPTWRDNTNLCTVLFCSLVRKDDFLYLDIVYVDGLAFL